MILACDVGGTKTRLALFTEGPDGALTRGRTGTWPSAGAASLEVILAAFLGSGPPVSLSAAGFGVAGPVAEGRARITNLPWEVDAAALARRLGLPAVALVNDVEATAWALGRLGPADVAVLQAGVPRPGTRAVIAVGTGVGYAALVPGPGRAVPLASEAGHADFAPRTEVEVALWRRLAARHGHVSVERLLSGPGLQTAMELLLAERGLPAPPWLERAARDGHGPAAVAAEGMGGRDATAAEALDLVVGVCGAEAGNWALRTLATGGLWLGGGVGVRLLHPAEAPPGWRERARARFLEAFLDKGRFRPLLSGVPVAVILDDTAALLGAAHRATLAG